MCEKNETGKNRKDEDILIYHDSWDMFMVWWSESKHDSDYCSGSHWAHLVSFYPRIHSFML